MSGFQLPFSYDPVNPVSVDQRAGKQVVSGGVNTTIPFASTTEACSLVPSSLRFIGLTVIVNDGSGGASEYWWRLNITDAGLVFKSIDTSNFVDKSTDQTIGGNKTFSNSPIIPTPSVGDSSTNAINSAFGTANYGRLASTNNWTGGLNLFTNTIGSPTGANNWTLDQTGLAFSTTNTALGATYYANGGISFQQSSGNAIGVGPSYPITGNWNLTLPQENGTLATRQYLGTNYIGNVAASATPETKSFNISGLNSIAQGGDLSFYNTADQTTNYQRVRMYYDSITNIFKILPDAGGTGVMPSIWIGPGQGFVTTNKNTTFFNAVGTGFGVVQTKQHITNTNVASVGGQFQADSGFSTSGMGPNSNVIGLQGTGQIAGINNQDWPVQAKYHPMVIGVQAIAGAINGATGRIPKIAAFSGTLASASTVVFTEASLIDVTFEHDGCYERAVGLRTADTDAGSISGIGWYNVNGDSTITPNGFWNMYNATGYANYMGSGAVLINQTTDNGVDKLQVTGNANINGIIKGTRSIIGTITDDSFSNLLVGGQILASGNIITTANIQGGPIYSQGNLAALWTTDRTNTYQLWSHVANSGTYSLVVNDNNTPSNNGTVYSVGFSSKILTFNNSPLVPTPSAGDNSTKAINSSYANTTYMRLDGSNGILQATTNPAFFGNQYYQGVLTVATSLSAFGGGWSVTNPSVQYSASGVNANLNASQYVNYFNNGISFTRITTGPPAGSWTQSIVSANTQLSNQVFTLPDKGTGTYTLATLTDITAAGLLYQPLEDQRLSTTNNPSFISLTVTPTDGTGVINLPSSGTNIPSTPSSGAKLFSGSNGFGWITSTGFYRTFSGAGLTASRIYTLPDFTDTLVVLAGAQTLTNKSISGSTNTLSNIANTSLVNSSFSVSTGTTGTDFNLSVASVSLGGSLQLNLPTASATNRGALSSTDWSTFNNKLTSPTTTLGDLIYRGASVDTRLPGNTTPARQFLTQTGTGSVSAAPAWFDLYASANTWTSMNTFAGTVSGVSGTARGVYVNPILQASSNNENQYVVDINGGMSITGGNSVRAISVLTAGSGYTNNTYNNITLTGGTGSGATGNFTVAGGIVTSAAVVLPGSGYTSGDVLSATFGGGTGLTLNATIGYTGVTLYSIRHSNNIIPSTNTTTTLGIPTLAYANIYSLRGTFTNIGGLSSSLGFLNNNGVSSTIFFGTTTNNWSISNVAAVDSGYRLDINATGSAVGSFRSTGTVQNNSSILAANLFSSTVTPIINNQTVLLADFTGIVNNGSTALAIGAISSGNYTVTVNPTSAGSTGGVQTASSGSGLGATFIVVTTVGGVTSVTTTTGGIGYAVGNTVTISANGGTIVYTIPSGGLGLTGIKTAAARFGDKLIFTPTTLVGTPLANYHEWDGSRLYQTDSTNTRNTIAWLSDFAVTKRIVGSGTGSATTISIAHGVSGVTSSSSANLTAMALASAGWSYITLDATNVNIVYATAPVSGTNNLLYTITIKP